MGKITRWTEYFRKGHGSYGSYIVSFANFIVIQYRELITHIAILSILFPSLGVFTLAFLGIYIPVMVVVGRWDWRRINPTRATLSTENNPWAKDLTKALYLLCDGDTEEAKKTLSKWIEEKKHGS